MKQNKKNLKEYIIKVGKTSYIFHDVDLDQSPSGRWVLTYGILHKMMKSIAVLILADQSKELIFEELEHLVKTAEISFSDLAEEIRISKSTISKWKESGKAIPYTSSLAIKVKMMQRLFSDIENRSNDPQKTSSYLLDAAKLPYPAVAA